MTRTVNWTATAAITLAFAVIIGAFGAHGLRDSLDSYHLGVYEKGVFYHFVHGLGLLALPLFIKAGLIPENIGNWAGRFLLVGVIFFSGSLYLLAITGIGMLGAVTPIGGVCFIAGWLTLTWGAMQDSPRK